MKMQHFFFQFQGLNFINKNQIIIKDSHYKKKKMKVTLNNFYNFSNYLQFSIFSFLY